MDCNYFYGGDIEALLEDPYRSGVSLQWVLDLMCEKIHGVSNSYFSVKDID